MAAIQYTVPNTRIAECFRVKEGSTVKISFQPPNRKTAGNMECNGVSVPNIFNLPFSHPLYIMTLGKRIIAASARLEKDIWEGYRTIPLFMMPSAS